MTTRGRLVADAGPFEATPIHGFGVGHIHPAVPGIDHHVEDDRADARIEAFPAAKPYGR
jgi:hypothetical protein